MTAKLSEKSKVELMLKPQDIGTADVTTAYFAMKGYGKARVHLVTADLATTKVATLQLMQATSSGGAGAKVLGSAVTFTASGTQQADIIAECDIDDLDTANGFTHIAATVGTDVNGTVGAVTLERGEAAYGPAT